jgi:hypothetical protein
MEVGRMEETIRKNIKFPGNCARDFYLEQFVKLILESLDIVICLM